MCLSFSFVSLSVLTCVCFCILACVSACVRASVRACVCALKNVEDFTYLGSCLSSSGGLNTKISCRLSEASSTLGRLSTRVWREGGITQATKIAVYRAVWLRDLDMLPETPQETGPVLPPLPPQAPGHFMGGQSPTRRYFTVPACQVLRS